MKCHLLIGRHLVPFLILLMISPIIHGKVSKQMANNVLHQQIIIFDLGGVLIREAESNIREFWPKHGTPI